MPIKKKMLTVISIDNSNIKYGVDSVEDSSYNSSDYYNYYDDLILLIILSTLFVLFSTYVDIRKTITSYLWWKVQFMLHPILVGIGVYYGIINATIATTATTMSSDETAAAANASVSISDGNGGINRMIVMTILSLFVFNFGIGPHEMPFSDFIFRACFYIHHIAPLFTCCICMSPLLVNASIVPSLYTDHSHAPHPHHQQHQQRMLDDLHYHYAMSSSIIFGYLWIVHPMTTLHRFKVINKENWFYPYMFGEFLSLLYYTWSILGLLRLIVAGEDNENISSSLSMSSTTISSQFVEEAEEEEQQLRRLLLQEQHLTSGISISSPSSWSHLLLQTLISIFPLALQYVGRWGLYVRVMQLLNWPKQNEPFYDWFGQTKQIWEFGSIILSTTIIIVGYLVDLI